MKNLRLLHVGLALVGCFTLTLGVFVDFYYFSFMYNVANSSSGNGVCYLVGGFFLVLTGFRLIWKNVPSFSNFKFENQIGGHRNQVDESA